MKKLLLLSVAIVFALPLAAQVADKAKLADEDEVEYNQYGQQVVSTPAKALVQDGILVFQAKKLDYKMWFDVRVQADAAVFFGAPSYADPIGNGASIRRARFAVKAQLDKNWYGEFDTDWSSGICEIKDALVAFTGVEGLELKAGNFKESFSMQRNTTSRYLMFMERPMIVNAVAPSRHLGFNARYAKDWFWISAGVFGPELKGSEEQTAMEDNNKDFGRNEGLSYTGKIVFRPLYKSQNAMLHIGGAFSYRQPKLTSTDGYAVARYSTRSTTNINRKKYLDTDAISGLHHELAWTAELAGYYKGLRYEAAYMARGAYLDQTVNPLGPQWVKGWYVQASYLLFGGSQNYDADGAKPTRIDSGRKWGDLELCLRYENANLNTENFSGGACDAYSIGFNYYPSKHVKIVLNYQYNNNDRYANGKGKLYIGTDASGKPTKDYTKAVEPSGKGGVDYSMIAMRVQVAF